MKIVACLSPAHVSHFQRLLPEGWELSVISENFSLEELIDAARDAEFLYVYSVSHVPAKVFEECTRLKMVHTRGVGYNNVDLEAATKAGVLVCNNKGINAVTVSEHTIGLMLDGLRGISKADKLLKTKGFAAAKSILRDGNIRELGSMHVGILGLGAIGKEVAKRLNAFGSRVSYYDVYRSDEETEKVLGIEYRDFDWIIENCDIITIHMPVFPSTRGIISRDVLSRMKDNALFINCARGELVDQDALCDILETGRITACVDVFTPEPVPDGFRMFSLNETGLAHLTVTPHFAGNSDQALVKTAEWTMQDFIDYANGVIPERALNR